MERKPGFQECPKCGLRNKPTAKQCDFCGQSLTISDDWQSHVKDLESLTRLGESKTMDHNTSRRIESTIIRKETPSIKLVEVKAIEGLDEIVEELKELDPTPEPQEIVEEVLAPVVIKTPESQEIVEEVLAPVVIKTPEPQEIVEEPTIEPLKEPPTVYEVVSKDEISIPSVEQLEIVEEPITEASPVIDSVKPTVVPVEKKRIPVEQQVATHKNATPKRKTPAPLVTGETKTEQAAILPRYLPKKQGEIRSLGSRFHISAQKAMVVLVIGTALYFVALTLSALGSFDKLGGLSTGAVSSVLIIFGAIMTYPSLKRKISGEVFICPKCHESVEKNEKTCPSCGARFFPED